jgi:hypothetical protein
MKPERAPEDSAESRCLDETEPAGLFAEVCASEGRVSADQVARMFKACMGFATDPEKRSLEWWFECQAAPGERSIATRMAEAKRLAAFVDAWRAMTDCEGLSDWRRCEVLAAELAEFESAYLPRWLKDGGPPAGASRLRRALYQAFTALERPPPRAAKSLHAALRRAGVLP